MTVRLSVRLHIGAWFESVDQISNFLTLKKPVVNLKI
jgi:hypothetical protein